MKKFFLLEKKFIFFKFNKKIFNIFLVIKLVGKYIYSNI